MRPQDLVASGFDAIADRFGAWRAAGGEQGAFLWVLARLHEAALLATQGRLGSEQCGPLSPRKLGDGADQGQYEQARQR